MLLHYSHALPVRAAYKRLMVGSSRRAGLCRLSSSVQVMPVTGQHVKINTVVPPAPSEWPGVEDLPVYSQFPLNRMADARRNTQLLSDLWALESARLVPLSRDKVLVRTSAPSGASTDEAAANSYPLAPVLLSPAAAAAAQHASPTAEPIFLGVDSAGAPYFALEVTDPQAVLSAVEHPQQEESSAGTIQWTSARLAGQELSPGDASLLAVASGLGVWNAGALYDQKSGAPTTSSSGGHSKKCSKTGGSSYPRVDPAVIMLVTAGAHDLPGAGGLQGMAPGGGWQPPPSHMISDWALLGRKAEWPEGRYSTLAGFVEVGEPLELAVAREVLEESSVPVALPSVQYAASQPWPFPRSLMIGFYACADTTAGHRNSSRGGTGQSQGVWVPPQGATGYDLLPAEGRIAAMDVGLTQTEVTQMMLPVLPQVKAAEDELQDCRWFHRDWLRACLASADGPFVPGRGAFHIPGPWSLANRLITTWMLNPAQPGSAKWSGDKLPQVAIDDGVFKYVLMRVRESNGARQKLLVWGDKRAGYHMDVFKHAKAKASRYGLTVEILGGGRIEHHKEQQVVHIYGYSAAFGAAPHEITAALIRRWYPLYDPSAITVSYEGY